MVWNYGASFVNPSKSWPKGIPQTVEFPRQTLTDNLISTVNRVPDRTALIFYGAEYTYSKCSPCGTPKRSFSKEPVFVWRACLLYMQNSLNL